MKINFKKEFAEISDSIQRTNYEVYYQKKLATFDNLNKVLLQSPAILHFSGHGL